MTKKRPTLEQVQDAISAFDDDDIPDGAWFQMIHDYLGVEVGSINDLLEQCGDNHE